MEKPYYVLSTTEIFPYDAESIDHKNFKKNIEEVLRPEFINNYDQPLKADTFKDYQNLNLGIKDQSILLQNQNDTTTLSDASKFLKSNVIPSLVSLLDDLQLMPIDSESLGEIFHRHGVNIRYLSHVACISEVPHVREICITEMFSRAAKNIINQQMSQLILDNKQEFEQLQQVQKELQEDISAKKSFLKS